MRENQALFRANSLVSVPGSWLSPAMSGEGDDSSSCVLRGLYPRGGRDPELIKGIL